MYYFRTAENEYRFVMHNTFFEFNFNSFLFESDRVSHVNVDLMECSKLFVFEILKSE